MAHYWKHSITVTPTMEPADGEKLGHYPRLEESGQVAARILVARHLHVVSLRAGVNEPLCVELAVPKLSEDFHADATAAEQMLNQVANGSPVTRLPSPSPGRMVETV